MHVKQNQNISKLLGEYFSEVETDVPYLQVKKFGARKSVYKMGDLINNLYFILSGQVSMLFHQKEQPIPPLSIVGDYEPSNQLSRRITQLKCYTQAKIVILPFDYYFNLRENKFYDFKFIKECLPLTDRIGQYLLSKIYKKVVYHRGQAIILQKNKDPESKGTLRISLSPKKSRLSPREPAMLINNNFAIIQEGSVKMKKYINIGLLKRQKLQVEKEFDLVEVGAKEIINEDSICESPKVSVLIFQQYYINHLANNFEDLKQALLRSEEKKESHQERCKQIKEACRARSKLFQLILPAVIKEETEQHRIKSFKEQNAAKKLPKRRFLTEGRNSTSPIERNHFKIQKSVTKDKQVIACVPTTNNLSLVPIVKLRVPSTPRQVNPKKREHLLQILKYRNQEEYELEQSSRSYNNSCSDRSKSQRKSNSVEKNNLEMLIPELFDNRFKKKMFLRANNPFHHFKTTPVNENQSTSAQKPRLLIKCKLSGELNPKPKQKLILWQ